MNKSTTRTVQEGKHPFQLVCLDHSSTKKGGDIAALTYFFQASEQFHTRNAKEISLSEVYAENAEAQNSISLELVCDDNDNEHLEDTLCSCFVPNSRIFGVQFPGLKFRWCSNNYN